MEDIANREVRAHRTGKTERGNEPKHQASQWGLKPFEAGDLLGKKRKRPEGKNKSDEIH